MTKKNPILPRNALKAMDEGWTGFPTWSIQPTISAHQLTGNPPLPPMSESDERWWLRHEWTVHHDTIFTYDKADGLEMRVQDLQNELDAHKAQGEVFAVDATRLSVCPPLPPPLPPRPATQTLADGAVVPASTVAPAAPTVASDFDAELLGACRKHHLTGRWRVVARRLKLWRIVQTAHALREHCDAPRPATGP